MNLTTAGRCRGWFLQKKERFTYGICSFFILTLSFFFKNIKAKMLVLVLISIFAAAVVSGQQTLPTETIGSLTFYPARSELKQRVNMSNDPVEQRVTYVNRAFPLPSGILTKFLCHVDDNAKQPGKVRFQLWKPMENTAVESAMLDLVYEFRAELPATPGRYQVKETRINFEKS